MRRITILIILLGVTSACSSGQTPRKNMEKDVENELMEGARSFKAQDFARSQQHFEHVLALDPANKKAAILLARVIHSQYRRDDKAPENIAKATEAISAYKKVLALDPNSEEALNKIVLLLGDLGRIDEVRRFAEEHANDQNLIPERRSDLYAFLASKDWECSFDITEENKLHVLRPDGSVSVQYKKPKDAVQYEKALKCITHGLEMAEAAIKINADSEAAWSQKYLLQLEAMRLAQMDGNDSQAIEYEKQSTDAREQSRKLHEKARQVEASPEPSSSETDLDTLVPPVVEGLRLIAPDEKAPTPGTPKQPK